VPSQSASALNLTIDGTTSLVADVGWSKAAIDSILEQGDLKDWQELFAV